ncbi:hypothetical protein PIB30_094836 [Stylosanthes scabra]|uniref:Uncharacterized protein n=1 Tax=Stylosanthes scabra TaxID=79078 RepID=A0ABU6RVI4_9FABA|nr:hypothetical protein [Stylosanthes scabra]
MSNLRTLNKSARWETTHHVDLVPLKVLVQPSKLHKKLLDSARVACATPSVAYATNTLAAKDDHVKIKLRVQLQVVHGKQGKSTGGTSPTRARVDKKGKKVVQTPLTRASARLAALKARTSPTPPPASSTPAMPQPDVKKPIFIDLTEGNCSEEDDALGNDPGFWDYDDLDDWGTAEPATSPEASCTSHPPPNR